MSTRNSIASRITRALGIVGKTFSRFETERTGGLRVLLQSITFKLGLLLLIFLAVPVLLFWQFQFEDGSKNRILQSSLIGQGETIAMALRPILETKGIGNVTALQENLADVRPEGVRIRVLFRPGAVTGTNQIFYVASAPRPDETTAAQLEADELVERGILEGMVQSCAVRDQSTTRYLNKAGQIELITSVTPVPLPDGCWAVITSHDNETLIRSSLGRDIWRTPVVQIASVIYVLIAGLVLWLAADIWTNLQRFRKGAEQIRRLEPEGVSFTELNRIPELRGAAVEFDRLVQALAFSRQVIRQAAEENAHALKTPLATISQAIEPLRRAIGPKDERSMRSINLIERSIERLDSLVSSARNLESAAADSYSAEGHIVDFSGLLEGWASRYRDSLAHRNIHLVHSVAPGLSVKASEDALETIFENLVENAVSFSPPGGAIDVRLGSHGGQVVFSVADEGPGVDATVQAQIFDRYFSHRPGGEAPQVGAEPHYGLGLWIVKRHVESFGGQLDFANRPTGGFQIVVSLPSAKSK